MRNFHFSRGNIVKFPIHHLRNKCGILPHVFYHQNVTLQFFRFSNNILTFTLRISWSSRSSKMLRLFSIQLLFSAATWIWSQSSKRTDLLTWRNLKSFIKLGSEAVVQRCSVTKGVFRNFPKLTGKHLYHSLFLIKLRASRPATLSKKRLWYRCFPVNFAKFLRTPFVTEHLRWLLL